NGPPRGGPFYLLVGDHGHPRIANCGHDQRFEIEVGDTMPIKRPVVAVIIPCAILAAALGGAAGYAIGRSGGSGPNTMIYFFTVAQSRYSSFLFLIRKDRNREAREDDLNAYLAFLDARSKDAGVANAATFAFDKALARIRLSQLAHSRGATQAATRLSGQADADCSSTALPDCFANNLLRVVRDRDRRAWGNSEKDVARESISNPLFRTSAYMIGNIMARTDSMKSVG